MKKNILVFTSKFAPVSETFIYNQTKALSSDGSIFLAATESLNDNIYPQDFIQALLLYNNTPVNLLDRVKSKLIRRGENNPYFLPYSSQKKLIDFIKENNIEYVYAHYGTNAVKLIEILKTLPYLKLYVAFHGYDASKQLADKRYISRLSQLINFNPVFIYCTNALKENIDAVFPNKNIIEKVIPYGVDMSKIKQIKAHQYPSGKIKIIHAGRLTEKKGVLDLLKTYLNLNTDLKQKTELHIVGDGEEYQTIKEFADKNNDASVFLHGAKPQKDLMAFVKGADIFVLNSRISTTGDSEGLPNAILEAMALKTAVISTNHAGIPKVVKNNETGLLVPEKDNQALKYAIEMLIKDEKLRERLSSNAYRLISENYSLKNMHRQLNSLFNE